MQYVNKAFDSSGMPGAGSGEHRPRPSTAPAGRQDQGMRQREFFETSIRPALILETTLGDHDSWLERSQLTPQPGPDEFPSKSMQNVECLSQAPQSSLTLQSSDELHEGSHVGVGFGFSSTEEISGVHAPVTGGSSDREKPLGESWASGPGSFGDGDAGSISAMKMPPHVVARAEEHWRTLVANVRDVALRITYKDVKTLGARPEPSQCVLVTVGYLLLLLGMKNSWDTARSSIFK